MNLLDRRQPRESGLAEEVRGILEEPERHVAMRSRTLVLSRMNVLLEPEQAEKGREVSLLEVEFGEVNMSNVSPAISQATIAHATPAPMASAGGTRSSASLRARATNTPKNATIQTTPPKPSTKAALK